MGGTVTRETLLKQKLAFPMAIDRRYGTFFDPKEGNVSNGIEGKLVHSTNSGRYAIDDPETGSEVVGGQNCAIFLGGNWINGVVEHRGNLYAVEGPAQQAYSGYYFMADDGGICGLCNDMKIRIPSVLEDGISRERS